ncbi:hypothetical protein NVP1215B_047 [Vibrio phage 1.215.B._10N.222.54.F7]|nr:hypothetical protein NVP1215A_047 [Vibrio phage 1.215.A._10N.222.54.F7]AUR96070.1 hypothetical protein NVP1215B_047 [Vibrio phage 1.215.B._10N.222.54.F7]
MIIPKIVNLKNNTVLTLELARNLLVNIEAINYLIEARDMLEEARVDAKDANGYALTSMQQAQSAFKLAARRLKGDESYNRAIVELALTFDGHAEVIIKELTAKVRLAALTDK